MSNVPSKRKNAVTPAKAGVYGQCAITPEMPACAGMTSLEEIPHD